MNLIGQEKRNMTKTRKIIIFTSLYDFDILHLFSMHILRMLQLE